MFHRLETWFRRQSVAGKLTTAALTSSGVTLVAVFAVFATYDYINLRAQLVRDVTMLADIVGSNSIGPIQFNDDSTAADTLRSMAINPHIISARLFALDGTLVSTYPRQSGSTVPLRKGATSPGVAPFRSRTVEARLWLAG